MSSSDPLNILLNQIADLLKLAQDNASTPFNLSDPTLMKRLELIREMVDKFQQTTMATLEAKGLDPTQIVRMCAQNINHLKVEDQRLMKKSLLLGFDTLLMKSALESAQRMGKYSQEYIKELSKKTPRKKIKERQKKFKRISGDSKWVKL